MVSAPHTLPGISGTKSDFVGWTLKWAKMGSAEPHSCLGFVF